MIHQNRRTAKKVATRIFSKVAFPICEILVRNKIRRRLGGQRKDCTSLPIVTFWWLLKLETCHRVIQIEFNIIMKNRKAMRHSTKSSLQRIILKQ